MKGGQSELSALQNTSSSILDILDIILKFFPNLRRQRLSLSKSAHKRLVADDKILFLRLRDELIAIFKACFLYNVLNMRFEGVKADVEISRDLLVCG